MYWRPGCGFCSRLFRALDAAGIDVVRHDIWADAEARRFVRAHNDGDETVPTVDLGGVVRTNPPPRELVAEIRQRHPHLVRPG